MIFRLHAIVVYFFVLVRVIDNLFDYEYEHRFAEHEHDSIEVHNE